MWNNRRVIVVFEIYEVKELFWIAFHALKPPTPGALLGQALKAENVFLTTFPLFLEDASQNQSVHGKSWKTIDPWDRN